MTTDLPLLRVSEILTDELVLTREQGNRPELDTLTVEHFRSASFSDGTEENDPQFAKVLKTSALVIFLSDKSKLTLAEFPLDLSPSGEDWTPEI